MASRKIASLHFTLLVLCFALVGAALIRFSPEIGLCFAFLAFISSGQGLKTSVSQRYAPSVICACTAMAISIFTIVSSPLVKETQAPPTTQTLASSMSLAR